MGTWQPRPPLHFSVISLARVLGSCSNFLQPAASMGTLTVTTDRASAVWTNSDAGTNHIRIDLRYSGQGFDPMGCLVYTAVGTGPFGPIPAQTYDRQTGYLDLDWPGRICGEPVLAPVTVQVEVVYTSGGQSVTANTSLTVNPDPAPVVAPLDSGGQHRVDNQVRLVHPHKVAVEAGV